MVNEVTNENDCVPHASSDKGRPAELWGLYLLVQKIHPLLRWHEKKQQGRILKAGAHEDQQLPVCLLCHPKHCTKNFLKRHILGPSVPEPRCQMMANQVNLHLFYVAT